MERRSGSMKIMSLKCLLAQPVVTACGHMEEGPNIDELRLEILGITVVGKNTLWTSKLGSDLHADFDSKEITF
jgi:hypothetical protein